MIEDERLEEIEDYDPEFDYYDEDEYENS